MKTKSLFLAALVLITSVAFAGKEEPRKTGMAVIPVKGSEIFKVIYKGETAGRVRMNIYNDDSKLILSETFAGVSGFIVPVNFSGLTAGEYTIELVDAAGKQSEKVSYKKSDETTSNTSVAVAHVSRLSSGKYLLSVVKTSGDKIRVRIYDENNNLLHSDTKVAAEDFAVVYNVKSTTASLTFEISDRQGAISTTTF